ncbi:UNVERIFIED_CONTAM: hypothetical protein RMT77_019237 [Armadillidium vulgare]
MGVSSCPMIGSYRPLRQTGKNSVCIRRIVCIRLSYQSGGCKSVESSFTGRALETSSKIEDCKGGGARAVLSGRFGVSELSVKYHYSHRFSTNSVRRESERRSPLVESYHVRF